MVATLTLSVEQFRQAFPEFADENVYSDAYLQTLIVQAQCYIHTKNIGPLSDDCRLLAWELMVAHLQTIRSRILSGQTAAGQVASTSIDSISVSMVPPPNKDQFDYWMNSTPYGQQLLALLLAHAPAGLYFGGSRQRVLR